jgi:hypothetical protein
MQVEGLHTNTWQDQVTTIRINPDFPLPDSSRISKDSFISLMGKGLETMRKIDDYLGVL